MGVIVRLIDMSIGFAVLAGMTLCFAASRAEAQHPACEALGLLNPKAQKACELAATQADAKKKSSPTTAAAPVAANTAPNSQAAPPHEIVQTGSSSQQGRDKCRDGSQAVLGVCADDDEKRVQTVQFYPKQTADGETKIDVDLCTQTGHEVKCVIFVTAGSRGGRWQMNREQGLVDQNGGTIPASLITLGTINHDPNGYGRQQPITANVRTRVEYKFDNIDDLAKMQAFKLTVCCSKDLLFTRR